MGGIVGSNLGQQLRFLCGRRGLGALIGQLQSLGCFVVFAHGRFAFFNFF